ncbi:MAG: hypothetical protein WKF28_03860 [Rubrobacteraceae bacterium]
MTRYYALVLVPSDVPKNEAFDAAFGLLSPCVIADARPSEESRFDHLLDPEDIIDWLGELQVEAIVTPDGRWHETEAGQLWDDDAWGARARGIIRQRPDYLAPRHVFHI